MKIKKIIIGLFAVCLMFSCENDESIPTTNVSTNLADKNSPVVQKLINMGYKAENIQEAKDFYIVEGDLMFSKNINDYSKSETSRHAHTDNLVSQQYRVITVRIDPSIPQSGKNNWRNAISSAMNHWSSLTQNSIKFVLSNELDADITIKSDNNLLFDFVIAMAGTPLSNGKAFNQILINFDFLGNMTVSESTKIYNMVHELGHCIGFRHTNWENEGYHDENGNYIGGNYIPNITQPDPNSVMNKETALYSWNGFSQYDIIAVNYLYPPLPCNTRLVGPSENRCAYNLYGDIANYTVYVAGIKQLNGDDLNPTWQVSGNSLEIIATNNSLCKIRVKGNNTTWPATGVVTRTSNTGCVSSYNISLNNCNDPYITD